MMHCDNDLVETYLNLGKKRRTTGRSSIKIFGNLAPEGAVVKRSAVDDADHGNYCR